METKPFSVRRSSRRILLMKMPTLSSRPAPGSCEGPAERERIGVRTRHCPKLARGNGITPGQAFEMARRHLCEGAGVREGSELSAASSVASNPGGTPNSRIPAAGPLHRVAPS